MSLPRGRPKGDVPLGGTARSAREQIRIGAALPSGINGTRCPVRGTPAA